MLIPAETEDNINFAASISILDEANIDLIVESGNSKKTENLDIIRPMINKYTARLKSRSLGDSIKRNTGSTKQIMSYEYELINEVDVDDGNTKNESNLHIELNGKVIDTFPMKLDEISIYERFYVLLKDYELQCNRGDEINHVYHSQK